MSDNELFVVYRNFFKMRIIAKPLAAIYDTGMFGFLNINKPTGLTSHDIVTRIRHKVGAGLERRQKPKVGHAGTLDPFAQGVLVICLGPATRLVEFVQNQHKRYTAEITLGATSTTEDIEGEITPFPAPAALPEENNIRRILEKKFTGCIQQVPPAHSAIHINGQRAYKLARAGVEVEMPTREVNIYELNIISYEYPKLRIDVKCGSGTYIRSLARDIGFELGVGGYCSELIRTAVGNFILANAKSLNDYDLLRDIIKPQDEIGLPVVTAYSDEITRLCQGKEISVKLIASLDPAIQQVAIIDANDNLVALVTLTESGLMLKPTKVFAAKW